MINNYPVGDITDVLGDKCHVRMYPHLHLLLLKVDGSIESWMRWRLLIEIHSSKKRPFSSSSWYSYLCELKSPIIALFWPKSKISDREESLHGGGLYTDVTVTV